MTIKKDFNSSSQNKNWFWFILKKNKNFILNIYQLILKCFVFFYNFFKKIWKLSVGVFVIIIVVLGGIKGYNYYKNTYLPEKFLEEAIKDIEHKFSTGTDSIKYDYACAILQKEYNWGYENVNDHSISMGLTKYQSEAFRFIESKAFNGDARSQYRLGQIYRWGEGRYYFIKSDLTKAVYWWNEAALQNYSHAYNNLGIAYKEGKGVRVDLRKAIHYLKLGAEAGEDFAQRNYGDLFLEGVRINIGSHKELRKTSENYYGNQKVRKYYDSDLMEFITIYKVDVDDFEILIPKDIEQAKFWWKKAAVQGNEVAKERLQKIYE